MKLLIIDDDSDIRDAIRVTLSFQWPDATILEAPDGASGIALAQREVPELIILDVNMPDMNGFQVCVELRKTMQAPILMLTVLDRAVDKVEGLEAGADDYLVKPFAYIELVARVRALLRRSSSSPVPPNETSLEVGSVRLDHDTRTVHLGERSTTLTGKEEAILSILLRNPGHTVSHRALLASVWGPELVDETGYLKLYIHNLRRKLAGIGCDSRVIANERGMGYRFTMP